MSENSPVSPAQLKKNRMLLLLIMASFVLPFVIGDMAYKLGWYKGGQTNNGQLIDPPAAFADFRARQPGGEAVDGAFVRSNWWLVYVMPTRCEAACRNRLFQMRQVKKALGREAGRVRPLLVMTSPAAPDVDALLRAEFPEVARVDADSSQVNSALARVTEGATEAGNLFIMDPMGWIMMSYLPEADEKESVIKAEDILNDLKKLLKASRIG